MSDLSRRVVAGGRTSFSAVVLGLSAVGVLSIQPARAVVLINEIYANPPGLDLAEGAESSREYVELLSTDGDDSLDSLWLLEIEGDGDGAGNVDNALDLSDLTFGSNGLLMLGKDYSHRDPGRLPNRPAQRTYSRPVLGNRKPSRMGRYHSCWSAISPNRSAMTSTDETTERSTASRCRRSGRSTP